MGILQARILEWVAPLQGWPGARCHNSELQFPHLQNGVNDTDYLGIRDNLYKVLVIQSCPILCDPMDCSLPGSSVHGMLQVRILEWVAIPFSKRSFQPWDWTWVSCIAGKFFTVWATREAARQKPPSGQEWSWSIRSSQSRSGRARLRAWRGGASLAGPPRQEGCSDLLLRQ